MLQVYTTTTTSSYTNGLLTAQVQDTYKLVSNQQDDSAIPDSKQTFSYVWWDGALQNVIANDKDYNGSTFSSDATTTFSYDSSGRVSQFVIADTVTRTVSLRTDQNGMIADRQEIDTVAGDPRTLRYFFGGVQLGLVTNNPVLSACLAGSRRGHRQPQLRRLDQGALAQHRRGRRRVPGRLDRPDAPCRFRAELRCGQRSHRPDRLDRLDGERGRHAADDRAAGVGRFLALVQARRGERADRLRAAPAGTSLIIPNKIHNSRNAADTFRPYDPNEALGSTFPSATKPPKRPKCGVFGAILLVAIAVAVTIVTSGAFAAVAASASTGSSFTLGAGISMALGGTATAGGVTAGLTTVGMVAAGAIGGAVGSIASQGLGVATGMQDKFSWKGVAMAGLSGGIGGGLGKVIQGAGFLAGAARGALGSAISQGVGVATGLQEKFDFAGVAAAAVSGGISAELGKDLPSLRDNRSIENVFSHTAVSAASSIANAVTRTALSGTSFRDNILAALPDVIGSTIGNLIGSSLAQRSNARIGLVHRHPRSASLQAATSDIGGLMNTAEDETLYVFGTRRDLSDADVARLEAEQARAEAAEFAALEAEIAAETAARTSSESAISADARLDARGTYGGAERDPAATELSWLAQMAVVEEDGQWFTDAGTQWAEEDLLAQEEGLEAFERVGRRVVAQAFETDPYGMRLRGARHTIGLMAQNSPYAEGYARMAAILDAGIKLNYELLESGLMTQFKAFAREYVRIGGYINPFLAAADIALSVSAGEITPAQAAIQLATLGKGRMTRSVERAINARSERSRMAPPEDPPFPPGSAGAARAWTIKARLRAAGGVGLPTTGRIRYVPRRDYDPRNPLPRGEQGGYIDRFGNEWMLGPSRTRGQPYEWDVQLSRAGREQLGWLSRDGQHVNVSLDGRVTH